MAHSVTRLVQNMDPLDILAAQIKNPRGLSEYMKKNFQYAPDAQLFGADEFWQTAEEMNLKKAGDCEDYALFAKAILERLGFQVKLISIYWDTNTHTIVAFKVKSGLGFFDLDQLKSSQANSVAGFARAIHRDWEYAALMRASGRQGVIGRKFKDSIAEKVPVEELFLRST